MKTGRIIADPEHETDADDGLTVRWAQVILPSGHQARAFIHDQPGDWYAYRKGDQVRLAYHDAGGDARAGITIVGKFRDDFEPVDAKNREIHGPADGDLVLRSRKDARLQGETVRLGAGDDGDQVAIALHDPVRADIDALHSYLDPTLSAPFGKLLLKINAALSGAAADELAAFVATFAEAAPTSTGAENVKAKAS